MASSRSSDLLTCTADRPMIGKKSVSFSTSPAKPPSFATKPRTPESLYTTKIIINDICTAIHISVGAKGCLGLLSNDTKHQQEVFLVESPKIVMMTRKSLQDLLQQPGGRVPGKSLSWRDSLNVAVTLASSIIQLDGTGWLRRQWTSEDVVFLTQDYTHPYLCWDIPPENRNSNENSTPSRFIRCMALASLGITLVE